jgi:hypothetical protein
VISSEFGVLTKESTIMTTLFYKIPPHLPLPAFGRKKIPKGGTIPLFGKWFDKAHHPELVEGEGLGEIFRRICLL